MRRGFSFDSRTSAHAGKAPVGSAPKEDPLVRDLDGTPRAGSDSQAEFQEYTPNTSTTQHIYRPPRTSPERFSLGFGHDQTTTSWFRTLDCPRACSQGKAEFQQYRRDLRGAERITNET